MTKHRRRVGLGIAAVLLLGLSVVAAACAPQDKAAPRAKSDEAPRAKSVPRAVGDSEPSDELDLQLDEPAALVLEFQEQLGSTMDGTVFDGDDVLWDNERGKLNRRQAVAEFVRGWERERRRRQASLADDAPPPAWPDLPPPEVADERVEALRSVGEQLDEAANRLERQELYERADQLRALAQQLRLDARGGGQADDAAPEPDFRSGVLPAPIEPASEAFLEEHVRWLRTRFGATSSGGRDGKGVFSLPRWLKD